MNPMSTVERAQLDNTAFEALKTADLNVLVKPYAAIGIVLAVVFLLVLITRIPLRKSAPEGLSQAFRPSVRRLWANRAYREGVVAPFFYVGAHITCWTFIIQYGTQVFMSEGMGEQDAEIRSQRLNIVAMVLFCCSRFVCTALMRRFRPASMLTLMASLAIMLTAIVIAVPGRVGLYCLVAVSACMSLMFPTIYGLSLRDTGPDTELGSAGLIMAILGGSLLPPVQAIFIDAGNTSLSFIVPLFCFIVVCLYGIRCRSAITKTPTQ